MRAAYELPSFPVFRPVDGDGDVLMADALPVERLRPDPGFTPASIDLGRPRSSWQPRFPLTHPAFTSRNQASGFERTPAVPRPSEQRNLASSPFGSQLRHLPVPLPSSPSTTDPYSSRAVLVPAPANYHATTLPPLLSMLSGPYRGEGYEHAARQPPLFTKPAHSPEVIDLTQDGSSPLRPRTHGGFLPSPNTIFQRLDHPRRSEDPGRLVPGSFPISERNLTAGTVADGGSSPASSRNSMRPQTPLHVHRHRPTRPSTPKVACTACLEEFKRDDLIQLACNCRYCTPCLNRSFEAGCANMSSFPPKCCGRPIRISIWGSILKPNVLARYKQVEAEFSANRPLYCASPKCSVFIPEKDVLSAQDVGVCPKCTSSTCTQCRRLMDDHPQWEIHERVCPKKEEDVVKLFALGSEKKWKQCPTCLNMVEKTDGCNHMDCVCGVEFCYRCGYLFDEDDSCECEPAWDDEDEDEDGDEDEDDDEEDEDEDSLDEEWPDYRIAVDPAGRPKCLHLNIAPLAAPLSDLQLHCHGCLQRSLLMTCEDCSLELCQPCVDKVQQGGIDEDEFMELSSSEDERVSRVSRVQDLLS